MQAHHSLIAQLECATRAAGLTLLCKDPVGGHYQIAGGRAVVSYYPLSKKRSALVEGAAKSVKHLSIEAVIALALLPVDPGTLHPSYGRKKGEPRSRVKSQAIHALKVQRHAVSSYQTWEQLDRMAKREGWTLEIINTVTNQVRITGGVEAVLYHPLGTKRPATVERTRHTIEDATLDEVMALCKGRALPATPDERLAA